MKILILTQDEPVYIRPVLLDLLCQVVQSGNQVAGVVLLRAAPGKRKNTLVQQVMYIASIFGWVYVVQHALRHVSNALRIPIGRVEKHVTGDFGIQLLSGSINSDANRAWLASANADLAISLSANQIFKRPLIDQFRHGIINVHTAKLPRHRGVMPTFWAMYKGDKELGVSVFSVDEGVDTGPIYQQSVLPIPAKTSMYSMIRDAKKEAVRLVVKALNDIASDRKPVVQREDQATVNRMPTRSQVKEFLQKGNRFF